MAKLLDYCKISGRKVERFDGEKKYVATADIDSGKINSFTMVDFDNKPSRANQYADINDIGFAAMKNTNKTFIINSENVNNIYSTGFYFLKCNENLNYKYLYYFINSNEFNYQKDKYSTGATMKGINNKNLELIEINTIPSIEKQENIVDELDSISLLIDNRKQQLADLDGLIKSKFIDMFGDPVCNNKQWVKKKLFDECEIITGNTPSRKVSSYYGNDIEWIKSDNISSDNSNITTAKEYLSNEGLNVGRYVDEGSILMTCIAGSLNSIGNVGVTDRKVSFNQQINGIVPNKNNVYFMYEQFVLSKDYLHTPVNMSLKGILSKNQLGNLEFIFPPVELQDDFGNYFNTIEQFKKEIRLDIVDLEQLLESKTHEYFGN